MRILHFNHHGTDVGGVEGYIIDASHALKRAGHESGLVYFEQDEPGDLLADISEFHEIVGSANQEYLLTQALDHFKPDIAFIHAVYDSIIVEWLIERLPVLTYVHGPYLVCPGSAQYLRRHRKVCPYQPGYMCLIRAQTEQCCFGRNPVRHWMQLRKVYSYLRTYRHLRVLVGSTFMRDLLIRSGIAGEQITISAPILLSSTTSFPQYNDRSRQILFAGRLVPEKGLDILIRAMGNVNGPWRLLIAGEGPERSRIEALVQHLNMQDQVEFLGWCSESRMERLYEQSAFVVIPSLWPEPYGRIGIEAAIHGRPAIAFDVGGVGDWLTDGMNGCLVPANDTHSLTASIQRLLDDYDYRQRLGRHAYEYAFERWSEVEQVDRLVSHFEAALTYWK